MRLCILFTLTILANLANSQTFLEPSWLKIEQSQQNIAEAWGIDIDSDGNVYWAVSTDDNNQGLDVKCYKFDKEGNELWESPFLYGGAGTQHAYVCNASSDELYIGGRVCPSLVTTCDMMLLQVSKESGELNWDKSLNFSANGYDEVDGLVIKEDGIYCGGWAQELEGEIYKSDIGLWKLDFDGNTEWTNFLGQEGSAEHQDGHFVVDDQNIYAAGLWNGTGIANLYNGHSFIGKFEKSSGELIDSTLFGPQSSEFLDIENALGMASDGEFLYVTGYSTPPNADSWQIFVAKFDKDLNQLWFTDWGGTGSESARAIQVENGVIYVGGLSESEEIINDGQSDAILLKLDLEGNLIEYQTWGDSNQNSFQDLAVKEGRIYLTGITQIDSDVISKEGVLLAIDDLSSIEDHEQLMSTNFILAPNPSSGQTLLQFDNSNHLAGNLSVYNAQGMLVHSAQIGRQTENCKLHLESIGMHLVRIDFGTYSISKKLMNF